MANPEDNENSKGYTNDDWTIEFETLGFEHAGAELYKMAVEAPAPFVIGVYGSWGSGKTSLLRHCMASLGGLPLSYKEGMGIPEEKEISESVAETWEGLKQDTQALTVWFNPWQYQNEPNPMIPLLHEIRKQIPKWAEGRRQPPGTSETNPAWGLLDLGIKKLTEVIDTVAEKNLGIKPAAFLYEKTKELYKGARPAIPYRELTDAQQFFLAFNGAVCQVRDAIKKMPENEDKSIADNLVIFIDDLDRCEDLKILEILEAIKLYLNTRSCVFILGIDPEAVERAIIRSRKDCDKAEARQYMAKLVQGSVHVPVCRDFRPFIEKITETWPEELKQEPGFDALPETVNEIWEHNPRKVKNFLNTLLARWKTIDAAGNTAENNAGGEKLNLDQTALLLSLQLRFPAIYKSIAFHPEDFENFLRALDYVIQHELKDTSHGKQPQSSESEEEQSWEQSGEEEQPEAQSDEGLRRRYIEELSIIFSQDKSVKLSLEAYRDRLFEYRYDRRLFERIRSDFREDQSNIVKLFFTTKAGRQ